MSIIVCSKDHPLQLYRLVRSIEKRTDYPNYELLLVNNGSRSWLAKLCFRWLARRHRVVEIESGPEGFNWARLNNRAAREVDGEFLLFLNDDMRVLAPNWLSALVGYSRFPGVGACGGRLLFENRTVQHAGLIVGAMGWGPWHALRGVPADTNGHAGYVNYPHNCLAVTGACLLTRRAVFEELGGFDEEKFAVSFNDVDYCLRLHERGLRSVFVPQAELLHLEGRSRQAWVEPKEAAALHERYRGIIDPYWNPNFSRSSSYFAVETRRRRREYLVARTPRLLVVGPTGNGMGDSPAWEPLFHELARRGRCTFVRDSSSGPNDSMRLKGRMERGVFDLVVVQGAEHWRAIELAAELGLPSVWFLPELMTFTGSFRPADCHEFVQALRALSKPYRVIFNNPHSHAFGLAGVPREHFAVLEAVSSDGLPVAERCRQRAKEWLEEKCGIGRDRVVMVAPADSVRGNGWKSVLAAYRRLGKTRRERSALLLLGNGELDYREARSLRRRLAWLGNEVQLHVNPPDIGNFVTAADIVIAQPTSDLRPRPVLLAMQLGIPIIGTEELVRSELLQPEGTGPAVRRFQPRALAKVLSSWIDDAEQRQRIGERARDWLRSRLHEERVIAEWGEILAEAAELSPNGEVIRSERCFDGTDGIVLRERTTISREVSMSAGPVGSAG
ncbi:MAG: glycosyltransferase [Planctomycetota bacterium]